MKNLLWNIAYSCVALTASSLVIIVIFVAIAFVNFWLGITTTP